MVKLTENQKKEILEALHVRYLLWDGSYDVIKESTRDPETSGSYYRREESEYRNITGLSGYCSCTGIDTPTKIEGSVCPSCLNNLDDYRGGTLCLVPKAVYDEVNSSRYDALYFLEGRDTYYSISIKNSVKYYSGLYVSKHPTEEAGIVITLFEVTAKYPKKADSKVFDVIERYVTEIVPNKKVSSYKIGKTIKDVDVFEAIRLNSKNIDDNNILWEGSDSMFGFFNSVPEFYKYTSLEDFFMKRDINTSPIAFFKSYMALYAMFPCIHLVVKSGCIDIVKEIILQVSNCGSQWAMKETIASLNTLINPAATNHKDSFILPPYIMSFLSSKRVSLSTYSLFSDIYSLDPMSKEQFNKFVSCPAFKALVEDKVRALRWMPDILKYGFTANTILNYCHKTYLKSDFEPYRSVSNIYMLVKDYLQMMSFMDPDAKNIELPGIGQIKTAHDKLAEAIKVAKEEKIDAALNRIAGICEPCVPEDEDYTIVIPHNQADFAAEASAQHNCVLSYTKRVAQKHCIIFFIRMKDTPNESYITAECYPTSMTPGGYTLRQVMYRNNRSVTDSKVLSYARKFCNALDPRKM